MSSPFGFDGIGHLLKLWEQLIHSHGHRILHLTHAHRRDATKPSCLVAPLDPYQPSRRNRRVGSWCAWITYNRAGNKVCLMIRINLIICLSVADPVESDKNFLCEWREYYACLRLMQCLGIRHLFQEYVGGLWGPWGNRNGLKSEWGITESFPSPHQFTPRNLLFLWTAWVACSSGLPGLHWISSV